VTKNPLKLGVDYSAARMGMVMAHGRGSTSYDMQSVLPMLEINTFTSVLIPQGPYEIQPGRFAWYRHFWNENLFLNLQEMDHSFSIINETLDTLNKNGLEDSQIILFGHSQGGNLLLEYFMTTGRAFKAVITLRSCLIGKSTSEREFSATLPPIPVILCSGRKDPFIPTRKVDQTKLAMEKAGARAVRNQYEAGHGITRTELIEIRKLIVADFPVEKLEGHD
jgi:predicted esterase